MRKKFFNFSALLSTSTLSFLLGFNFILWPCYPVRGEIKESPGLPIARLALPTLVIDADINSTTGTRVGAKVNEFNKVMRQIEGDTVSLIQTTRELYENAIEEVNQYYITISNIEVKLQLGTTPGNPLLIASRETAREQLNKMTDTIKKMATISSNCIQVSNKLKNLSQNIKETLQMPGAVDEDHAHLILMSDKLAKMQYAIGQTLDILNANAKRQNEWLATERGYFAQLTLAINKGQVSAFETSVASSSPLVKMAPKSLNKQPRQTNKRTEKSISESMEPLSLTQLSQEDLKEEVTQKASATPHEPPIIPLKTPAIASKKLATLPQADHIQDHSPSSARATKFTKDQNHELSSHKMTAQHPLQSEASSLPLVDVASRPTAHSIPEEGAPPAANEQSSSPQKLMPFANALNGRTPLGSVDHQQDLQAQKWYIFSTASRGIKGPTSVVEIINVIENDKPTTRGDEVKKLLVEMGLNPSQLQVTNAKSESDQTAQVLILGK